MKLVTVEFSYRIAKTYRFL
jgi:hypothetical protein